MSAAGMEEARTPDRCARAGTQAGSDAGLGVKAGHAAPRPVTTRLTGGRSGRGRVRRRWLLDGGRQARKGRQPRFGALRAQRTGVDSTSTYYTVSTGKAAWVLP